MRLNHRLGAIAAGSGVLLGTSLLALGVSASTDSIDSTGTLPGGTAETTLAGATSTTTLPIPVPPPADNEAEPQTYYGRIKIPKIEVDSPFIEGIRLSTLDYGPGHWPGTAMPGELGNVVVAGHRTSHNADFRRLDELVPGDEVIFDLDDSTGIPTATVAPDDPYSGVWTYEVVSVEIVGPEAMWVVNQNPRHEGTLFACHPPGSVAERIIVFLDLKNPPPDPTDPPRPTTTLPGDSAPETVAGSSVPSTDG